MRSKTVLLVLISLLAATALSASCTAYGNSTATDFPLDQGGPACAYTGPGCNECITSGSSGFQACYWSTSADVYCYDYGALDNEI